MQPFSFEFLVLVSPSKKTFAQVMITSFNFTYKFVFYNEHMKITNITK
jgi:hypothetical protein